MLELVPAQKARFFEKVAKAGADECWHWTGAKLPCGQGVFGVRKPGGGHAIRGAHRVMWAAVNGPVDPGVSVTHKCGAIDCCNPAHLQLRQRRTRK